MTMHGPEILVRTLSKATSGTGSSRFAYGNRWQYHSRSDRHSKIACWALMFDLLRHCALLRDHAATGRVGMGINHEMHDFRNRKRKNLDLVICVQAPHATAGGSKGGAKNAKDFAAAAKRAGLEVKTTELVARGTAIPDFKPLSIFSEITFLSAANSFSICGFWD